MTFPRRQSVLLLTVVLFIIFSILQPHTFLTESNLQSLLLSNAVSTLVALAVLIPVVVGEFDLSVGYVVGFAAVIMAALGGESHYSGPLALMIGLLIGTAIGTCNGVLVAKFKINSLIATLGVGLAVSGLSVGASGSQIFRPIFRRCSHRSRVRRSLVSDCRCGSCGPRCRYVLALCFHSHRRQDVRDRWFGPRRTYGGCAHHVIEDRGLRGSWTHCRLCGAVQLGLSGAADPSFGSSLLLPAFAAVFLGSTTVRPRALQRRRHLDCDLAARRRLLRAQSQGCRFLDAAGVRRCRPHYRCPPVALGNARGELEEEDERDTQLRH